MISSAEALGLACCRLSRGSRAASWQVSSLLLCRLNGSPPGTFHPVSLALPDLDDTGNTNRYVRSATPT